MYLTDYREETLSDAIKDIEPELFKKVANLSKKDFTLLCDIRVFNATTMNSAVFAFRRLENPSLHYAAHHYTTDTEKDQTIGGFTDSYATKEDVIKGRVG